ncbi:adenosine deaminase [Streptomyces longispororuber]|uniref:adenosine deaminase n=1 Tax=Streptomyces longispororuber TaxID=68230 RepID=UPI00210992E1|nr:adenosine deaminase [Streptomyces longispororuber]MCQ4210795.1 adenosine deaminase [Streptomyces longispororuber]
MSLASHAAPHLERLARIPKAELHLHIEGTLEPELAFELAARNGITLPYADTEALRKAYLFADLQSFLDLYYSLMAVLITEDDFESLADAYLARAAEQGVRHAEIFFDPQAHMARGVEMGTVVEGLARALERSEERHGVSTKLIMCFLRDQSAESAMETLEAAEPYLDKIVGVGLDSAEVGNPASKFRAVYEAAGALGLRKVAHAGEEGDPSYVWEALDLLGVERVDHGLRSLEDPELVARLVRDRIPLTLCPLSNVRLRAIDVLEQHPLVKMMDAGLLCTVNSDDPAYFGGYVGDTFHAVHEALGLDHERLRELARNSFVASFLDGSDEEEARRARYIAEVDAYEFDDISG